MATTNIFEKASLNVLRSMQREVVLRIKELEKTRDQLAAKNSAILCAINILQEREQEAKNA